MADSLPLNFKTLTTPGKKQELANESAQIRKYMAALEEGTEPNVIDYYFLQ